MHPQMLRTWPQGRQELATGAHNLVQNNGKRNFSQNWSNDDTKKNRLLDFYDIFYSHVKRNFSQNWSNDDTKKEQSDQGLHCLPFPFQLLDSLLNSKTTLFKF